MIGAIREYRHTLGDIAEHRAVLEGDDEDLRELAKGELPTLQKRQAELEERIKILITPRDPNDDRNVLLEIRAGTGGEEASLFANELFRMYTRYAERHRWKVESLSLSTTGLGGIKEVIALIAGRGAYSRLKFEGGVHRVQRVPATEAQGRIHTSAATVAVMPEADDVEVNINEEKDLRIDVMRASGPGGQSVNTTDSAVRITHIPTGMVIVCRDEKSQHKNKARALKILRARLLELAHAEQDAKMAATRRSMVGTGDRSEAHPHLQFSAVPRHRPSRQPDAASTRPGARRRDRSAHRRASHARAGRGAEHVTPRWIPKQALRRVCPVAKPRPQSLPRARAWRGPASRARAWTPNC